MEESQQVQAIRARYIASFPEKAEMVAACVSLVKAKSVTRENLLEVKEHMHKLAGSSGMYGYKDICDVARSSMIAIDNDDSSSLLDDLEKLQELLLNNA